MSKPRWFRAKKSSDHLSSARYDSRRPRFECLEGRRLLTMTPVTVEIEIFRQLEDPEGPFDPSDTGNFYPTITIGDHPPVSFIDQRITQKVIANPGWTVTKLVDISEPARILIGMSDYDQLSFPDIIDIHPDDGTTGLEVFMNPLTGQQTGGNIGMFGAIGAATGDGDSEHFPVSGTTLEGGTAGEIVFTVTFDYLGGIDARDTDEDGLFDEWETNGIDFNRDGIPELDLPLLGADPEHKDLFVEVDAMSGLEPIALPDIDLVTKTAGLPIIVTSIGHGLTTGTNVTISGVAGGNPANGTFTVTRVNNDVFTLDGTAGVAGFAPVMMSGNWRLADLDGTGLATGTSLDLVINSFLNAPTRTNPDFTRGINLHIQLDENDVVPQPWDFDIDDDTLTPLGEDVNADGILGEDVDGDKQFDHGEDRDGDGVVSPEEDAAGNGNGVPDFSEDLNGNGIFDDEDLDDDGRFDGNEDANGNGMFDMDEDLNGNFTIDFIDQDELNGLLYYKAFKEARFGTGLERAFEALGAEGLLDAKRLVYRYSVFAHSFIAPNPVTGRGVTATTSGIAYGRTDFVVSLGLGAGTADEQAGTFMHELGHTLGLDHGGGDGINYKPNYHSVMNYTWQIPDPAISSSWELDYSEGTFGTLNERFLNESVGLRGDASHAGHSVFVGPPTMPTTVVSETGAIDWNGDTIDDDGVPRDLNRPFPWLPASPNQLLVDHDDWFDLELAFGDTGFRFGDVVPQDLEAELTLQEVLLARELSNTAPTITSLVVDADIDEGETVTVTGEFDDSGLGVDTFSGSSVWSDGVSTTLTIDGVAGTFSTERTFADDDPTGTSADMLFVEVTIEDGNGGTDSETSQQITVNNVAPSITEVSLGEASIDEGQTVQVTGSFDDPALGVDTFVGTALWSDGVATALVINGVAGTFSTERHFADDDPTGTPADEFTVRITISDDDFGEDGADSQVLTVRNVDPVISQSTLTLSAAAIDENGSVALEGTFTDVGILDTHTVIVMWGDDNSSPADVSFNVGVGTFSATHQYLDDNPSGTPTDEYHITVIVTDDDTGTDTATISIVVNNVGPVIEGVSTSSSFATRASVGEPVTLSGAFTDIGTLDTHTATLNWGEPGGLDEPANVQQSNGSGTISAEHVYQAGGVYNVVVRVTDDDTGADTQTTISVIVGAGVNNGVLQIVGSNDANDVTVNQQGNGQLTVLADFFLNDRRRSFGVSEIDYIQIWLGDGDDHATIAGSVDTPAIMYGGLGNDHLKAGGARSILIGGPGSDRLIGGTRGDILIGGDTDLQNSHAALIEVLERWNTSDSYAARVAEALAFLDVLDDGDEDRLNGNAGHDLFFDGLADDLLDVDRKHELTAAP